MELNIHTKNTGYKRTQIIHGKILNAPFNKIKDYMATSLETLHNKKSISRTN